MIPEPSLPDSITLSVNKVERFRLNQEKNEGARSSHFSCNDSNFPVKSLSSSAELRPTSRVIPSLEPYISRIIIYTLDPMIYKNK